MLSGDPVQEDECGRMLSGDPVQEDECGRMLSGDPVQEDECGRMLSGDHRQGEEERHSDTPKRTCQIFYMNAAVFTDYTMKKLFQDLLSKTQAPGGKCATAKNIVAGPAVNNNTTCFVNHDIDEVLFPTIYIIVIVVSVPANLISLYVSYLQVTKKNELGIYLFNLSFADLLYALTLPLWVDFSLHHDNWRFSEWLCRLSSFLMHTNLYSSAGFLTCVSLDRYLAVVYPLKYRHLRTRKVAALVSLTVWTIQCASNIVIVLKKETYNDTGDLVCYDVFPMERWKAAFSIFNVCVGHFLPLLIMVVCYYRIYVAVSLNQATADKDKRKIRQLLLAIMVTFVLSFTPYHVVLFLRSIYEPGSCHFAKKIFQPYKLTLALSSVNCLADPLLYCFVSEIGRADAKAILYCFQPQGESPASTEYKMSSMSPSHAKVKSIHGLGTV
ncbi:PREDICTED: psychosine receptor [Nanorana parkeri]|uniref:psychosine receptor n=1 Tax=Nanorana parkeri TaxID=125878 RepID=UPI00085420C1|nr:PREDICTED: psychosine receptor [Nanorana parkeri]